jgi:hypothetical protein
MIVIYNFILNFFAMLQKMYHILLRFIEKIYFVNIDYLLKNYLYVWGS